MPVRIILQKIGFAMLMFCWVLMELQASVTKTLVLIRYRKFPIGHKVCLQDILTEVESTLQSSVSVSEVDYK